jgi:predicted  nucleic acid-binding Zn-ribbon protein
LIGRAGLDMKESQLRLLMFLQDLLCLKKEIQDFQVVEKYEEMGFALDKKERIEEAIKEVTEQLDPVLYQRFLRIAKKYDRPLAPLKNGVCYGCFVSAPTGSKLITQAKDVIEFCNYCGRIMYRIS